MFVLFYYCFSHIIVVAAVGIVVDVVVVVVVVVVGVFCCCCCCCSCCCCGVCVCVRACARVSFTCCFFHCCLVIPKTVHHGIVSLSLPIGQFSSEDPMCMRCVVFLSRPSFPVCRLFSDLICLGIARLCKTCFSTHGSQFKD